MADIVVEIKRGMLIGLYSDTPEVRAVLVDWDDIERRDDQATIGEPLTIESIASMSDKTNLAYRSAL